MTIQKGICAECGKEYEYEYNPQFPRKYCHECSAAKKASFTAGDVPKQQTNTAQPVNAPIVKPGEVKKNGRNPYDKDPVGLAVDVFCAMMDKPASKEIGQDLMVECMEKAIELVKQAKEAFE